jgi:nickel-dependent lactate racemase
MDGHTILCRVSYGKEELKIPVPGDMLVGEFRSKEPAPDSGESDLIQKALNNPIGSPRLEALVKRGSKVAIVVDDNTRPTPTAKILPFVLDRLFQGGVEKKNITIVFANGTHRLNTREEQIKILGDEKYLSEYRISDHDPHDKSNLTSLGKTSRGTSVDINSYVAEADVRVLIGLIKPHAFAGYTGGGKSILPGVSSLETVIADHNYKATDHPRSVLGVIDGNLIRGDIEEAAHLVDPCFIVNVILSEKKEILNVVAGDMIAAHRRGTQILDTMVRLEIPETADIIIAGCSHPTSVNLYQSSNALLNCIKVVKPIIKKGGIIILASPCPEGIGDGPFYSLIKAEAKLEDVLKKLADPSTFVHDQWAAQVWATMLLYCDVYIVASGIRDNDVREMKAHPFASLEEAFAAAVKKKGASARVTVLTDAPYIIPDLAC